MAVVEIGLFAGGTTTKLVGKSAEAEDEEGPVALDHGAKFP
jgi:hypothetical protein